MKYCDKCKIKINTNNKYCPLCQQVLEGEQTENLIEKYPEYVSPNRKILPITKKIIMFITAVSIIILLVINLATYLGEEASGFWSIIPIGSIIYFWMIISFGVFSRQNIALRLVIQTAFLIGLLILIDEMTYDPLTYPYPGRWSYDFVMPFLLGSCNLAISIIILIKRIDYRDYIIYLLTIVILSLTPIILVFLDIITILWPALMAFGLAIFILLFIIFFFPKSIKDEIKKRFHA
jgi:hypothetical protein